MILDYYFKKPVFWDYLLSILFISILIILYLTNKISIPSKDDSYTLTGDLTNISLTIAGFILTILTLLITFKDSSSNGSKTNFKKFFETDYYHVTVNHLKNCIKSIIIVASIGFLIKLFFLGIYRKYFFFYNVFGLTVTLLTIWRCLLILSEVLKLQKDSNNNNS